jgi:hypothetical protein
VFLAKEVLQNSISICTATPWSWQLYIVLELECSAGKLDGIAGVSGYFSGYSGKSGESGKMSGYSDLSRGIKFDRN